MGGLFLAEMLTEPSAVAPDVGVYFAANGGIEDHLITEVAFRIRRHRARFCTFATRLSRVF